MSLQFTVSPDFPPVQLAQWYLFNTWLQKATNLPIHLEMYSDFEAQRKAIKEDKVDLIYANPYDAATLVREKGFTALTRPTNKKDEAVIITRADAPYNKVEELKPGTRVAIGNDPTINLLGFMMLEPAELSHNNVEIRKADTYAGVARLVIQGEADIAFMLKEAMDKLTNLTRHQLKVLVESQIEDLHHTFLASPRVKELHDKILNALLGMHETPQGAEILKGLEISSWTPISEDEMEFMINLVEALK